MKKYLLVLYTISTSLFLFSCEKQEISNKPFVVSINGKDLTYYVKTSHYYADKELGFGDMQIMGENSEYGEFSHCVINIEYKLQGNGEYVMTDLATLNKELDAHSTNKYVHVHVNLGVGFKDNIAKYRFTSKSGYSIVVHENKGYYDFNFSEPVLLSKISYLGTPPKNAPFNINLKVSRVNL